MRKHPVKSGCIFLLLLLAGAANAATDALNCRTADERRPAVLQQAPNGVRRLDRHTLEVRWQRGRMLFRDSAPFDEPLMGVHWRYCLYDRASGFHLIQKLDENLGTGVLLQESTGQVLDAGRYVIFSPHHRQYFAARQPNGLDGEQWILFSANGHRLWQGLSGINGRDPDVFIAELSQPRWNAQGRLQATHTCMRDYEKPPSPRRQTVTLEFTGGRYRWLPVIPCT